MVSTPINKGTVTKVFGLKMPNMVLEKRLSQLAHMMVISRKARNRDLASSTSRMTVSTKENLRTICSTDKVSMCGNGIQKHTLDFGKRITCTAKEFTHGATEENTPANS